MVKKKIQRNKQIIIINRSLQSVNNVMEKLKIKKNSCLNDIPMHNAVYNIHIWKIPDRVVKLVIINFI